MTGMDYLVAYIKDLSKSERRLVLRVLNENVESFEDFYERWPKMGKEVEEAYEDDDDE